MRAEIIKRCSVICEPGSIVEVSERQMLALGDYAIPVKEEPKKAPKKKKEE